MDFMQVPTFLPDIGLSSGNWKREEITSKNGEILSTNTLNYFISTYYLAHMELVEVPLPPDHGFSENNESFVKNASADSSISDSQSDGFSSTDSGKGVSNATTPADSIHDSETISSTPWHHFYPYSTFISYSKSLGSVMPGHAMIYEFEIPQIIVGRLIGRYGSYVNKIKLNTRANIIVKRHHVSAVMKICAVEGLNVEIEEALLMIRQRFPIKRFPYLSLDQVNNQKVATAISFLPSNNKLNLIDGVINDVYMSCIVDLDHIFVQLPTHPTFPSLSRLHQTLKALYDLPVGAPRLTRPFTTGVVCVACLENDETEWFRAEVIEVHEDQEKVTARLVDVGGYVQVPIESLRQIRVDFVTIPFQAIECKLANLAFLDGQSEWSNESLEFLKKLSTGQVLQAYVIGYSNNLPIVHLYRLSDDKTPICINEELVTLGYAKWVENDSFLLDSLKINDCDEDLTLVSTSINDEGEVIENMNISKNEEVEEKDEVSVEEKHVQLNTDVEKHADDDDGDDNDDKVTVVVEKDDCTTSTDSTS